MAKETYKCGNCLQDRMFDTTDTKEKSDHRQIIEFFHDMTLKARGFKPRIGPKDAKQLKNVIDQGDLTREELEKMTLYFLADPSYNNLGPSIATMLSSTVLNSLENKMRNRTKFYKELDAHADKHMAPGASYPTRSALNRDREGNIADRVKELKEKLTMNNSN